LYKNLTPNSNDTLFEASLDELLYVVCW